MSDPELDFSKWLGIQMVPSPGDPNYIISDSQGTGILLTEQAEPETHRGRGKRKTFWSATIRVHGCYEVIGNDFDRATARDEAWEKLKEQVRPLIQNLERLGLLPSGSS